MSISKSYRKMCPDFIVNDFVTKTIKTVPVRAGYGTVRVNLKNVKITDKTLTYCALTPLSVVCRKGCLLDIVDVVVKSAPKNKNLRGLIPVKELFSREAFFYNTILVDLLEFQQDCNVNGAKFEGVPTLLAATVEKDGEEAIILQNAGSDWSPKYEKWIGELTQAHIKIVLKEFARFHALNFAFAKTNAEKVEEFRKELNRNHLSTFDKEQTLKIIQNNLQQSFNFFSDENVVENLKKFSEELPIYVENILNGSSDVNVLIHGDPSANFLFCNERSEEGTTIISKAKFIDWQLVGYGSPVLDLSLFLFTNCSPDDFNNLQQLLRDYHNDLTSFLKEFLCDVDDFLPFERFETHWKKYSKFGLAMAFLALKIITLETNKRPDANNEELSVEDFIESFVGPANDEFIRRIKDLVEHVVNNKLI